MSVEIYICDLKPEVQEQVLSELNLSSDKDGNYDVFPQPQVPAPVAEKKGGPRMRNILKATTLESKFPLLAVEGGCIISKDADITVAYRVELPELFTVTSAEYEAIHAAWCKALKVLPEYSVVHKQDWVRHDVV